MAAEQRARDTATAVWAGGLRTRVTAVTASGPATFMVDSAGPSPTDHLLVALASCYAAALAWVAGKRQVGLPDLMVTATGSYHGQRFQHLLLTVHTSLPWAQLDPLLTPALRVCYVSNTISGATPVDVEVAYPRPGAG